MDPHLPTVPRFSQVVFGIMIVISRTPQVHTAPKGRTTPNVWSGGPMVNGWSSKILHGASEKITCRI